MRNLWMRLVALALALAAGAGAAEAEFNVALLELGASGKVSGCGFNRDWPVDRALSAQEGVDRRTGKPTYDGGLMLNAPMAGARIDVALLRPVPVHAVELIGLDYHSTRLAKKVDVLLDGKPVRQGVPLPERAGEPTRVEFPETSAAVVTIVVTEAYPPRKVKDRDGKEKDGPNWGGFARLRVYSHADLRASLRAPDEYDVPLNRGGVAVDPESVVAPRVYTRVRRTKGNPCTVWDKEDVAEMRAMLRTSKALRQQYDALKRKLDQRLRVLPKVPAARRDAAGRPLHLPEAQVAKIHNQLSLDICDFGIMYALSGEDKYGEGAKKLLLDYAREFPGYGIGARPGFAHDPSKVFDQRLGDATWLIQVVRGYDLIYNLPSLAPEERRKIEDDLIKDDAYHIAKNSHQLHGATNWSAIATAAVLLAGYACHDQKLINLGTTGDASKEDPDPAATAASIRIAAPGERAPRVGGYPLHFSARCIGADGLWSEGAIGYQFMAMQALIVVAETVRHHGINMYAACDGAVKKLFDSPMRIAYEDFTTPGLNDSSSVNLFGYNAGVWEYGYRNYRDPNYLSLLKHVPLQLHTRFQIFTNSILYDVDKDGDVPPPVVGSVNFSSVGNGVSRLETPAGQAYVLLDYGPFGSHGHPDKLNLDVFANGAQMLPDPGMVWYEQPLYRQWYRTTVAHNTLVVGERDQRPASGEQIVFLPGQTAALQRARTVEAYPGVVADRAAFMLPEYLLDVFGAFARTPRRYDLAWHLTGKTTLPDGFAPRAKKLAANGYAALDDVVSFRAVDGLSVANRSPKTRAAGRLLAAAGADTEYISGLGHVPGGRATALIERREAARTVFVNALEYAGAPTIAKLSVSGGLEEGFAAVTVEHANGMDHAFVAYRPGKKEFAGFTTDALQALARLDREGRVTAAFFAGGTQLSGHGFALARAELGSAAVERTVADSHVVVNGSATAARITLKAPWNRGLRAVEIDPRGNPLRELGAAEETLAVPAAGRLELLAAGGTGYLKKMTAIQQERAAATAATEKAAREAAIKRNSARRAAAMAAAPQGIRLKIAGKDFVGQGGGKVNVLDNRVAAENSVCQGWNDQGHYLEWKISVPQEGYYAVGIRYCTELKDVGRELTVNGEKADCQFVLRATGGWARAADDWAVAKLLDEVDGKPLPVKFRAGDNVVRLTNTDGKGVNLDYIEVVSWTAGD